MKKYRHIIIAAVLLLLIATLLCACGGGSSGGKSGQTDTNKEKWVKSTDLGFADTCKLFLSSFTNAAKSLSVDELDKGNRTAGINTLVKVKLNDNDFWVALKVKYNYKQRDNTMMSLELSDKEIGDKYDPENLIFGAYLYQQLLYVAVGQTKFSIDLKTEQWNSFFPFRFSDSFSSDIDPATVLVIVLKSKKDFTQKKRDVRGNQETIEASIR